MVKVDIKILDSTTANDVTATKTINDNFEALQNAIEDSLSRSGKVPNYMQTDLDLNHNKLINLADPKEDRDAVTLKYVKDTIGDVKRYADKAEAEAIKANKTVEAARVYLQNSVDESRILADKAEEFANDAETSANIANSSAARAQESALEAMSAKEYAEQAANNASISEENARQYAEQAEESSTAKEFVYENIGRLNQIGYYGTLVGDTLAFEKPVGEEEYELKKGFTYLVDLQFEAVGDLDDNVKIVIKNNDNNVNIVNVIHSNPDEPVTVGELKQIMRYNTVSGWRWIFNAWYTETQGGSRVLVMPSTVVADEDVDTQMSDSSENAVQNKVIKSYIDTTEQDIISGYMNADSDLQLQINGQATVLTEVKDDVMSNMTEIADLREIVNNIGTGGGSGGGSSITVDAEMSDTSENPVQNKIVKAYIDGALENVGGSGHNVGDIFYTTRLDTELNGAVECNGATYNIEDFTGEETIANLLTQNKIQFVDFTTYESILTTKGSCEYFGWENGENFRVPTLPCVILSGNQSPVVGNGMALGLTDGSKNGGFTSGSSLTQSATGNLTNYGKPVGTTPSSSTAANKLGTNIAVGVTTDPNYSGLVVDLDYLGLEYKAMVQLATGATDEALITATTVLQTLANKADKDGVADINLNNISTEAKNFITGAIAPSDKFVSLTLGANASKYEAPANGWFNLEKEASAPGQYITLFNNATRQGMRAYQAGDTCSASLYVKKGESVTVYYDCAGDITIFSFTYAEGENN